ncbi:MAG: type IV pilus secretin PilQ [Acidobacteria bacterium]|nr:MAG: type IV pilus secretin PilQ [Acidobacteriota bacterium]REK03902.1 MAG: type IV pilus secretin PilQ [Acidobacteriota bacterium]REK15064.1 MAG: type IV pilus secretin PilQ [Acidobacteriota bacterium]REK46154.1 MAG: type IV pilus secretin PilQ [Acidobacteriota bacterium]
MTLVQKIGKTGSRAIFVLVIMSSLLVTAFAQDVAPQNQGMKYGEAGFQGEAINLNVVNADIRDILNYITEQYGINFVIDRSVKDVPVTVNVSEVPWNVALDSILRAQELGVQVNGPILRISDQKSLAQERKLLEEIKESQLDSAPLYTEFVRLNYARAINDLSSQGGRSSGYTGGQTTANTSSGAGVGGQAGQDQGVLGIVQKRLSRRGTVEVEARTNTLIITDVLENVKALRRLISYLDQPAPQVEIEARIVAATRNFSRDLGLKLSGVAIGNKGETVIGAGTDFGSVVSNTIISLTTSAIGTTTINAELAAGEQKGHVKTIATPRITTLNNRPAEIESGSQIPVTTIQPNSSDAGVVVTTEYVPVPLRLAVTPQITNVGTIILNVVAENNTVPAGTGDGGAPPISVQRMQTEVMVPDGGTTVVGGALFDSESEIVNRTPGLSRIPIIGNLFKRKTTARDTSEILFFITPRIYRPDYDQDQDADVDEGALLVQPVPLGNPPSNSNPTATPKPNRPTVAVPADDPASEVQPASSPNPDN